MADETKIPDGEMEPANKRILSLSQVLLAPLDAIFKAQIHGARSFLNLVLQLGTPHAQLKNDGKGNMVADPDKEKDNKLFQQDFYFKIQTADGEIENKLSVPALALVPLVPLAIEDAQFDFDYTVSHIAEHEQLQKNRNADSEKRPWYLVEEPVSLRGVLAPQSKDKHTDSQESKIKISIKLGKQLMPSGLDKLLTTINQASNITSTKINS
jgi:uncharacterized protein DUF2589